MEDNISITNSNRDDQSIVDIQSMADEHIGAIDWFDKNKLWTKAELKELESDPERFKLYAWLRGIRGTGHHHRMYRKVFIDDLYASYVKCTLCNQFVNYNRRTGTSYMLRHITKYHADIDIGALPEPAEFEIEPERVRRTPLRQPRIRTDGSEPKSRGRPKKRERRSQYMDEMRFDDEFDYLSEGGDPNDDQDKAIKLLTGLLVKHEGSKVDSGTIPKDKRRIEEYTDKEIDRELKEIELHKARAELREVEVRIKEREERISLYKEVKCKIGLIASRINMNMDPSGPVNDSQQFVRNSLSEAYQQFIRHES